MILLGLVFPFQSLVAQERVVTGKVIEYGGEEILGANVIIKGTAIGTVTDAEGNYSLSVPDNSSILVFSFIGYEKLELEVGSRTVIDAELILSLTELSEVVVVGYGTQQKRTSQVRCPI